MQIYLGDGSGKRLMRICQENNFGRMIAQNWPELYDGEPWGFDNGAWGFHTKGIPFDDKKFFSRIEKALSKYGFPIMAIAPDIVAGGMKSLEFSLSYLGKLPDWPWYLAIQDGMEVAAVIDVLPKFKGIFLGGSDEYKAGAGYWLKIAHAHNLPFHFGRCGTLRKLAYAMMINVDSLDSSYPLWTKDRLYAFIQAFSQCHFPELVCFESQKPGHLVQV